MMLHSTMDTTGRIRKEFLSIVVGITLILLAILPSKTLNGQAIPAQHAALLPFRTPVTLPSPGPSRSKEVPAKGTFLVASEQLRDPNFSKTVVLLIDYNRQGAMGLVINRPTEVRLSRVLPEIKGLRSLKDTVFFGGPVVGSQMLMLIRSGSQPEESRRVFEDIYVSSNLTVLQWMIANADAGGKFHVYVGFSGWSPGQLDRELSRGDWHVLRGAAEIVFHKEPSTIWPELIRRSTARWTRIQEPAGRTSYERNELWAFTVK